MAKPPIIPRGPSVRAGVDTSSDSGRGRVSGARSGQPLGGTRSDTGPFTPGPLSGGQMQPAAAITGGAPSSQNVSSPVPPHGSTGRLPWQQAPAPDSSSSAGLPERPGASGGFGSSERSSGRHKLAAPPPIVPRKPVRRLPGHPAGAGAAAAAASLARLGIGGDGQRAKQAPVPLPKPRIPRRLPGNPGPAADNLSGAQQRPVVAPKPVVKPAGVHPGAGGGQGAKQAPALLPKPAFGKHLPGSVPDDSPSAARGTIDKHGGIQSRPAVAPKPAARAGGAAVARLGVGGGSQGGIQAPALPPKPKIPASGRPAGPQPGDPKDARQKPVVRTKPPAQAPVPAPRKRLAVGIALGFGGRSRPAGDDNAQHGGAGGPVQSQPADEPIFGTRADFFPAPGGDGARQQVLGHLDEASGDSGAQSGTAGGPVTPNLLTHPEFIELVKKFEAVQKNPGDSIFVRARKAARRDSADYRNKKNQLAYMLGLNTPVSAADIASKLGALRAARQQASALVPGQPAVQRPAAPPPPPPTGGPDSAPAVPPPPPPAGGGPDSVPAAPAPSPPAGGPDSVPAVPPPPPPAGGPDSVPAAAAGGAGGGRRPPGGGDRRPLPRIGDNDLPVDTNAAPPPAPDLNGLSLADGSPFVVGQSLFQLMRTPSAAIHSRTQLASGNLLGGQRFADITLPLASIVSVDIGTGVPAPIHASHVNSTTIAAQGPFTQEANAAGIPAFFVAALDNNVEHIVNLTNQRDAVGSGRNLAVIYWPGHGATETLVVGNRTIKVTNNGESHLPGGSSVNLTVEEPASGINRTITVSQFSEWPDHGVPGGTQLDQLMSFMAAFDTQAGSSNTMVHCKAGVGRTGTFIVLRQLLDGIRAGSITRANLLESIRDMVWEGRIARGRAFVQSETQMAMLVEQGVAALDRLVQGAQADDDDLSALGAVGGVGISDVTASGGGMDLLTLSDVLDMLKIGQIVNPQNRNELTIAEAVWVSILEELSVNDLEQLAMAPNSLLTQQRGYGPDVLEPVARVYRQKKFEQLFPDGVSCETVEELFKNRTLVDASGRLSIDPELWAAILERLPTEDLKRLAMLRLSHLRESNGYGDDVLTPVYVCYARKRLAEVYQEQGDIHRVTMFLIQNNNYRKGTRLGDAAWDVLREMTVSERDAESKRTAAEGDK